MSGTIVYRSKQINHVQVALFTVHIITFITKLCSETQRIQVKNGQFISILFMIPIVADIHSHRFEIFTWVSEIHENVDLVFGIKNIFELESIINS